MRPTCWLPAKPPRPQLHLIRASRRHSPKQGAVFNCPGTPNLFRSTVKGRCPRGVTPLGCSLVLSLREKEQSTKAACCIGAAGSSHTLSINAAAAQGFRLCGGGQRAFRSPFGNLRAPFGWRERTGSMICLVYRSSRRPPCLQHQCCCSAGIPPLRRRPKGFPVALWKPSGSLRLKGRNKQHGLPGASEQLAAIMPSASTLLHRRDSASAEAAKGLSGRPLETFGSPSVGGKGCPRPLSRLR